MAIGILDITEVFTVLESKLNNEWVYLAGDLTSYNIVENKIYTPGTEKNRDFEIIFIPTHPGLFSFGMCRKNDELRNFLHLEPLDFDCLIGFELFLLNGMVGVNGRFLKKVADRKDKIKQFINLIKMQYEAELK